MHFPEFSNKDFNFISRLFENSRITSWVNLRDRYEFTNDMFFQCAQLRHAIPVRWKKLIFCHSDVNGNDLFTKIITLSREIEFAPRQNTF